MPPISANTMPFGIGRKDDASYRLPWSTQVGEEEGTSRKVTIAVEPGVALIPLIRFEVNPGASQIKSYTPGGNLREKDPVGALYVRPDEVLIVTL